MKNVLVCGSLAYDYIMNFKGRFGDHILPNKVHILNVSFTAENLHKLFGGCAGNIGYNLSLLKEKPTILATAGNDFNEYKLWLKKNKVDVSQIEIVSGQPTASAHVITDKDDNQITAFYGGAMLCTSLSIKKLAKKYNFELAIVSPDCKGDMIRHIKDLKNLKIPYIFDPGQQIINFTSSELRTLASGSKAIILNDYELQLFLNKAKISKEKLSDLTKYLIITLGKKGSEIYYQGKKHKIPCAKPKKDLDPTGAGDAFRAGIIKGLLYDYSVEKMGKLAALLAVYTVELYGTQTHSFTLGEFEKRYQKNFKEKIDL